MTEKNLAILVGTYEKQTDSSACEDELNELESLGHTYGVDTVARFICPIRSYDPATLIGKGKVEEIKQAALEHGAKRILFNDEITPKQQQNLEKALECTVMDRAELIIGVFAQRAQSAEAKIQIELASVRYQLPRLRRLWTHLSRQKTGGSGKAGGGYLKGEGEKQIEIDRRILGRKIDELEKQLSQVKKTRATQRQARLRRDIPTFALVGYTNVGKSTLLKALTSADVLVEDKLFATLDTTTRQFHLPNGQKILLTDTVGFIRKLPHLLVAAFRSTLEEAIDADILLHVIDVSHKNALQQAETTLAVLKELGSLNQPILTLLNKVDACPDHKIIDRLRTLYPKTVALSALHRTGTAELLDLMTQEIASLRTTLSLRVPQAHYALVSEVMREGRILSCEYEGNEILLEVNIPRRLERKVAPFIRLT